MRGYTTFTQQHGDEQAAELASVFVNIATETLTASGGTGLEFRGDEVLAVFTSARGAIRAAIDLQDAFVAATITNPALGLPVGVGLDAGEAVEVEDGYRGGALNRAARLCSIAGPGEILASQAVIHLAGHLEGVTEADRGALQLKGISDPLPVIRITREGWDPDQDVEFQKAIGKTARRKGSSSSAACPYRGLAAFQPEHADSFFGRDRLVEELVEGLDHDRMLFVVGPSGSGKSSVVRAGLIPAINRGVLPGSDEWVVALFTPRGDPSAELLYQLRRLVQQVDPSSAAPDVPSSRTPDGARRLTDAICGDDRVLLMVIDQFEELFTLSQRREQEAFVEILAAVLDPVASRVRIVLSMRADFYGTCATFPWLAKRVPANQVLVGPMSRTDLRSAVEQPASSVGLRLEAGLADAVLEDAGSEPSALPLVSHAMAETWRRRDGDTLTLAGYREAGGVAGAISKTADSLYETVFDKAKQDACRRLMLRLVTPGEGTSDTRRRLSMDDFDRDRDPDVTAEVAEEMIDVRLLTVDRESLEIAHEALLHSWPRLRDWIEKGRDDLRMRQRIGYAAAEWDAQDRDPDLLSRGTPLQAALEWAEREPDVLGSLEQDYLESSEQAVLQATARRQDAARKSRRVRTVLVAFLAVLAAAAVVSSVIALSALGEARSRYGQALASQATFLADSDPRAATALALEAMARGQEDSIDSRSALVDASQVLSESQFVPSGAAVRVGDASSISVSPDGELVVTGNRDGTISLWSPSGQALSTNVPGHIKAIEEMDFTPDGQRLITGSDDSSVLVWDLADPADVPPPTMLGQLGEIVWSVAVAPDGESVATATEDGAIELWDLDSGRELKPKQADLEPDALTVAFSPDGKLLLAGNGAGQVVGWHTATGRVALPPFYAHTSDVWEIEFSPDGTRFATASSDGRVRVWHTADGTRQSEPFAESAEDVRGVLFDPDGHVLAGDENGRLLVVPTTDSTRPDVYGGRSTQVTDAAWGEDVLAVLGSDQQMQIWSRGAEPTALVLPGHGAGAFALATDSGGTRVATGDGRGNVRVFSAETGELQLGPVSLHTGRVWGLDFSEDGSRIASAGEDGAVQVIDADTAEPLPSPPGSTEDVYAVMFHGEQLLSAGADGVVRIWAGETLEGELGPLPFGVTTMAISPDGVLAVSGQGGAVQLWSVDDQEPVGDPLPAARDNWVWGLDWSTDGRLLAVATADEVVQVWDVSRQQMVGSLTPQPGGALAAMFLSDGQTIATTSRDDGSVRLWDVGTFGLLGRPLSDHDGPAWRGVALPGMRFATSSEDGTVRVWDVLDPERACDRAAGVIGMAPQSRHFGEDDTPLACVEL